MELLLIHRDRADGLVIFKKCLVNGRRGFEGCLDLVELAKEALLRGSAQTRQGFLLRRVEDALGGFAVGLSVQFATVACNQMLVEGRSIVEL